jgi:hypothetical protein
MAYVRTAGWYRYLFPAHALALLFAPAALFGLSGWLQTKLPRLRIRAALGPLVLFCMLSMTGFHLYQLSYSSYVAHDYRSTASASLERRFAVLRPEQHVFFYETPHLVVFLEGGEYSQYLHPVPSLALGEEQLAHAREGTPDIIVAPGGTDVTMLDPHAHYPEREEVAGYLFLTKGRAESP